MTYSSVRPALRVKKINKRVSKAQKHNPETAETDQQFEQDFSHPQIVQQQFRKQLNFKVLSATIMTLIFFFNNHSHPLDANANATELQAWQRQVKNVFETTILVRTNTYDKNITINETLLDFWLPKTARLSLKAHSRIGYRLDESLEGVQFDEYTKVMTFSKLIVLETNVELVSVSYCDNFINRLQIGEFELIKAKQFEEIKKIQQRIRIQEDFQTTAGIVLQKRLSNQYQTINLQKKIVYRAISYLNNLAKKSFFLLFGNAYDYKQANKRQDENKNYLQPYFPSPVLKKEI